MKYAMEGVRKTEGMGLSEGRVMEIRGTSTTAAKCLPLYPSDWVDGITRMDAMLRYNAGVSTGDPVEVRKTSASSAPRVLLTPLGERSEATNFFIKHWQEAEEPVESKFASEALSGTPVLSGDFVMVDYRNYRMFFLVLEKEPSAGVSVGGEGDEDRLGPLAYCISLTRRSTPLLAKHNTRICEFKYRLSRPTPMV